MSTKHFFQKSETLVELALEATAQSNPSIVLDRANKTLYQASFLISSTSTPPSIKRKVAVVIGGGSGHEPAFSGYVGRGALAANISGSVFASPSAEQIRRCLTTLGRQYRHKSEGEDKGVCVIVMNYTGDVLNFGMGVEKAKAEGVPIEMMIVGDDVGVGKEKGGKVGRRGISGTVLTVKIAGALAETGASLKEVLHIAELVASNCISIGASLSPTHIPGHGAAFEDGGIPDGELEIGMGIHNEPGCERIPFLPPTGVISRMLARLLDPADTDRAFLSIDTSAGDEVVLLINNLGGLSQLELGGLAHEALRQLRDEWKIVPVRVLVGTYQTSLNMLGLTMTLLRLRDTGLGQGRGMLDLLDAEAEVAGWSAPVRTGTWNGACGRGMVAARLEAEADEVEKQPPPSGLTVDPSQTKAVLSAGLQRLIEAEPDITRYDTIYGDGDCGTGMKRGAQAVLDLLSSDKTIFPDAAVLVHKIAKVIEMSMDGTSGALHAIFLNALSHFLATLEGDAGQQRSCDAESWAKALNASLESLAKYTPAKVGDRTLIDAVAPLVHSLGETGDTRTALKRGIEGAEKTKEMKPRLGRAVYVGEPEGGGNVPDPGAYGLAMLFSGMLSALGG